MCHASSAHCGCRCGLESISKASSQAIVCPVLMVWFLPYDQLLAFELKKQQHGFYTQQHRSLLVKMLPVSICCWNSMDNVVACEIVLYSL